MKIDDSPIDRKLLVLEAYVKSFASIEEAQQKFADEISSRAKSIEELLAENNVLQCRALRALNNNNDLRYAEIMQEIKQNYEKKDIDELQEDTLLAIKKQFEKEKEHERPTEAIKVPEQTKEKVAEQTAKPAEMLKEQPAEQTLNLAEMPKKEYYQSLVQKYNGKMYEIRQKITGNMATEEEMDAWFAWFVQDLVVLKKRKGAAEIVQEERDFLKEHLLKWSKKPIMYVFLKELRELGID